MHGTLLIKLCYTTEYTAVTRFELYTLAIFFRCKLRRLTQIISINSIVVQRRCISVLFIKKTQKKYSRVAV